MSLPAVALAPSTGQTCAPAERVLADRHPDPVQVVADGEHLAALLADGEELAGGVALAADRALDVGDERHAARFSPPASVLLFLLGLDRRHDLVGRLGG